MNQKDVFISYKTEEFDEANWVKATLETNGITCWMAPMSIPGGSSYAVEIPQAIRQCKVFVLILSEKSQQSKWVPRELDQAINENKTVMPFMLENCALKDDFNFYLTNVQRYAAYESKSRAIEKMIREIKALLEAHGEEPAGDPQEPRQEPEPQQHPAEQEAVSPPPKAKEAQRKPKASAPAKGGIQRHKVLLLVVIASVVLIGLLCAVVFYVHTSRVTVAGKTYSVSDTYIKLSDLQLTEEDIGALPKLQKLRTLSLENCTILCEDLSPLSRLDLQTLVLNNCHLTAGQIESIDFSAMERLWNLDLSGNEGLSSLETLSAVSDRIKSLKISHTSVSALDGIARFQKLTEFRADDNAIEEITGLGDCAKLTVLSLNGNQIRDLTPLSGCSKLRTLYVNGNQLTSLSGLEPCIELQEIHAGGNRIASLDGLCNATLLHTVFLSDNQITDLSVLAKSAEKLQKVYLRNNRVEEIYVLGLCSSLTHLDLDQNRVTSLVPLADCSGLEALSAAGNQLVSITGLTEKPNLTYLNLADNQIALAEDEVFSFSSTEWVTLELSGNAIVSLYLPEDCKFWYLGLHGNPLRQYESLYASKGYHMVLDYQAGIDFAALAETEYSDYVIVDCPLGEQVSVREQLGQHATTFAASSDCVGTVDPYIPKEMLDAA